VSDRVGQTPRPRSRHLPQRRSHTRVVGEVLLEQDEHWQLEGRRMFAAEGMAISAALDTLQPQASLQEAAARTQCHPRGK
jgi:putative transposase